MKGIETLEGIDEYTFVITKLIPPGPNLVTVLVLEAKYPDFTLVLRLDLITDMRTSPEGERTKITIKLPGDQRGYFYVLPRVVERLMELWLRYKTL